MGTPALFSEVFILQGLYRALLVSVVGKGVAHRNLARIDVFLHGSVDFIGLTK